MLKRAKRQIRAIANKLFVSEVKSVAMQNLLLAGRLASWQGRANKNIHSLSDVEFRVSSQMGEDGIVDWLIEIAQIPAHLQSFIEFGVESYTEANTLFLLQNRNWRGLVMDGRPTLLRDLKASELFWRYNLTVRSAFITRENIDSHIIDAGYSGEIGLLSVDIDGNDYWVWEAISSVQPVLFVCEYNAVFGDIWPISVPYDAQFQRTKKHFSNLYFGASIGALCSLATSKGYVFLGTNMGGTNAFFVRKDYAGKFESALESRIALPSSLRDSRDASGNLNYAVGLSRSNLISSLPVVNVETGETTNLGQLDPLYSKE